MSSEKLISLKCSDGKTLEVDEATAFMSESIKSDIRRARRRNKDWPGVVWKLCADPLLYRNSSRRCFITASADAHADLHAFDHQFLHGADPQLLANLTKAAFVLDIGSLYELASSAFYDLIDQIGADMEQYTSYHRNVPF